MSLTSGVMMKSAPASRARRTSSLAARIFGSISRPVVIWIQAALKRGHGDRPSKASSLPARSSAARSSEPPTCTPIDKNLRHGGSAAGALDHLIAFRAVGFDIDIVERDAFLIEEPARPGAVAAPHRRIHLDFRHDLPSFLSLSAVIHVRAPRAPGLKHRPAPRRPASRHARIPRPSRRWSARRRSRQRACRELHPDL